MWTPTKDSENGGCPGLFADPRLRAFGLAPADCGGRAKGAFAKGPALSEDFGENETGELENRRIGITR
jgi:hypothetical protein